MKAFTGWQYLCLDVANNHHSDLDKKTFEERIQWVTNHLQDLEDEAQDLRWKERPLYLKAVAALRKAQAGKPTGHMVGFDAICSGMQIMSTLTGCYNGAKATGLIDKNRRADAYTECTNKMSHHLGYHITGARKKVKQAVMTALYGSKAEPKAMFGEDTPELNAFYQALWDMCPGACMLLEALVSSWSAYSLTHDWVLPDGFTAKVKVMERKETRIEVEELAKSSFTYVYYENEGKERDCKNAANVVHSIDAYVLRSLVRRCSYDLDIIRMASDAITYEMVERKLNNKEPSSKSLTPQCFFHWKRFEATNLVDPSIIPYLTDHDIEALPTDYLKRLLMLITDIAEYPPFPIITVHDDFKCHPNNMNVLRKHYKNILAEMADSNMLNDILSQLYQKEAEFVKLDPTLGSQIRQANYALS